MTRLCAVPQGFCYW